MSDLSYRFEAKIWLYHSDKASWHFVTVPKDMSDHIKSFSAAPKRGFGSVRIKAEIGTTQWSTSIFPDKKSGCYFLPLKAEVREKQKLIDGQTVTVTLGLDIAL